MAHKATPPVSWVRLGVAACALAASASAGATTLPVGPIGFNTNAEFDANFKEPAVYNSLSRNATFGFLSAQSTTTATSIAVYDTSATGGSSGNGGTGGSDANNDLGNFTVSGDFASTAPGIFGGGFLLRLNSSEASGYLASMHVLATFPRAVNFELYEGAGTSASGFPIFSQVLPVPAVIVQPNTFYSFSVTVVGGKFTFDLANGSAHTTFVDPTVSAVSGQVGVLVDQPSPADAAWFDNFKITAPVPEPTSAVYLLSVAASWVLRVTRRAVLSRA